MSTGHRVTGARVTGARAFGAYPMVEEARATGRVAAVYADLLEAGTPFVPSLVKSLALCPPYLVLAHDQLVGVLGTDELSTAAQDLATFVRRATTPPRDAAARDHLGGFAAPVSRMLLLSAGLLAALDAELDAPPASPRALREREPSGAPPAPATEQAPEPELYGDIRAALRTPVVNTVWRSLADAGHLEAAWGDLAPQVATTRPVAEVLQERTRVAARALPWRSSASPASLAAAGIGDAEPGMRTVLETYLGTLSRVLPLVASSTHP